MGNNYKLSFSELILEKGKWEIKQSVLKISNIEDFLRFFTIFSNYDLSKLGFTNFNNSNIFLKNITKDRKLKEEIELFSMFFKIKILYFLFDVKLLSITSLHASASSSFLILFLSSSTSC